jgi:hypothetical protein
MGGDEGLLIVALHVEGRIGPSRLMDDDMAAGLAIAGQQGLSR